MQKNIYHLAAALFMSFVSLAQSPNWQWAKSAGGTNDDEATSVAVDANGNCYVAGRFLSSSMTFGSANVSNSGYGWDMFLVKYSISGNILWAKSIGGSIDDKATSVAIDANGNIYVAGQFNSPSITIGFNTLINKGYYDIFLVKYDSNGNVLWAKSAGGSNDDKATSVSVDATGNCYLVGGFGSTSITFDYATVNNTSSVGNHDMFLVKYSLNGSVAWALAAGGFENDYANSITVYKNGYCYVAGRYNSSSITFGSTTLNNSFPNGWANMFLVKYDLGGNVMWAKSAGGTKDDEATSVSVDANGYCYVAGGFNSSSITFGSTSLTSIGSFDMFLAKYDLSGNVLWARSAGGTDNDVTLSIDVDATGNCHAAGGFYSSSMDLGDTTIANYGYYYLFIVKYDSTGNILWATTPGGTSNNYGASVVVDANGDSFVVGGFYSLPITFGNITLTTNGSWDMFVAKHDGATGIEENNFENEVNIFPNPFSTKTVLQTENNFGNATLTLVNCIGKTVKQIKNISGQTVTLQRDNFPSGFYYIRLTQDNKVIATEKIVITD